MQSLEVIKDTQDPLTYNDKVIDHSIPDGQCMLAQNCFLDNNEIVGRTGYTMVANDTGENQPNLGFCDYETPSGKQILKINDNAAGTAANLFYWTGTGNWVKVTNLTFTHGLRCAMVVATGKVYISNGVDTVKRWDGSNLVNIGGIPATPYLAWFHNFLLAMQGSRVNISDLSTPESFPVGSYIDINPDDGDIIIGSGSLKDELIISKNSRMYTFQGWTEASFSVSQVNEKLAAYGATGDDTFANVGIDLLFMSFGGGIPHVRSLESTIYGTTVYGGIVTNDQEGTMKSLSFSQLGKCAAVFDGRKAWFFMPSGSSTFNDTTLVYDTITKGVTKHKGIYAARAVVSNVLGQRAVFFADSRNSKVYKFDGSYSDNGQPIEVKFISRRYQPDFQKYFKWKYMYMQYVRNSTGNVQILTSVDDDAFELLDTIDLHQPTNTFPFIFPFQFSGTQEGDFRADLPSHVTHNIQLQFYKNDMTAPFHIHDFSFLAKPKPYRKEIPFPAN